MAENFFQEMCFQLNFRKYGPVEKEQSYWNRRRKISSSQPQSQTMPAPLLQLTGVVAGSLDRAVQLSFPTHRPLPGTGTRSLGTLPFPCHSAFITLFPVLLPPPLLSFPSHPSKSLWALLTSRCFSILCPVLDVQLYSMTIWSAVSCPATWLSHRCAASLAGQADAPLPLREAAVSTLSLHHSCQ